MSSSRDNNSASDPRNHELNIVLYNPSIDAAYSHHEMIQVFNSVPGRMEKFCKQAPRDAETLVFLQKNMEFIQSRLDDHEKEGKNLIVTLLMWSDFCEKMGEAVRSSWKNAKNIGNIDEAEGTELDPKIDQLLRVEDIIEGSISRLGEHYEGAYEDSVYSDCVPLDSQQPSEKQTRFNIMPPKPKLHQGLESSIWAPRSLEQKEKNLRQENEWWRGPTPTNQFEISNASNKSQLPSPEHPNEKITLAFYMPTMPLIDGPPVSPFQLATTSLYSLTLIQPDQVPKVPIKHAIVHQDIITNTMETLYFLRKNIKKIASIALGTMEGSERADRLVGGVIDRG
ncbi:hypothetical protein SBOR_0073 [Sclerotinia borealis F-4128]|uniref:Uncharacterized protein n=1 Tax=Sclerotinia borealis (strain F-4128) TaxID=1432307 RepID=W9CTP0_SCLBF|nr:hypothetical protein SBOR_0073 [Sclerotinia borealis F-4128]